MTRVSVCGSLNYDLVTFTGQVPDGGETISAGKFETHAGGKGLNQTVALRRLLNEKDAVDVEMIGHVGDDAFGVQLKEILESNGVDTSKVGTLKNGVSTGVATILVEQSTGQNRILISEGANGFTKYSSAELDNIFPELRPDGPGNAGDMDHSFVVFQNEIPATIEIMRWLAENRPYLKIAYNPSPFKEVSSSDWALVDLLVVNEIEALQVLQSALSKTEVADLMKTIENQTIDGYKQIALELRALLSKKNSWGAVVITLGKNGSVFCSHDLPEVQYKPAIQVPEVIDTTGAGDTFLGGVVSKLCTHHTLTDAVDFATKASSLGIQRSGAAESIPSYQEVENLCE
ncbi:LAME_0G03422g1_1 [Lachancea meyersii CBS 8951]|uniref:Ribokinase n=1 Tax=Lachancea meyersii CBS 8951 TaxID=1266667 RepID=A0A1G4K6N7_9SACH|nr:LAME_0G03422g1_1 [Lachancea meyersii CBS 8951]